MKLKFFIISVLLSCFCLSTKAQLFSKDTLHFNFSAGVGWPYKIDKSRYKKLTSLPSFNAEIEMGVYTFENLGTISIGVKGTYKFLQNSNVVPRAFWHNYIIGVSSKFYFNYFNELKFIPYAGVFAGINAIKFKDEAFTHSNFYPTNYNGIYPLTSLYAGVKYQTTPKYGVFGEIGWGSAYASIGVYANF